jgi:hypothetical protein
MRAHVNLTKYNKHAFYMAMKHGSIIRNAELDQYRHGTLNMCLTHSVHCLVRLCVYAKDPTVALAQQRNKAFAELCLNSRLYAWLSN